jgi:hypothetical protein
MPVRPVAERASQAGGNVKGPAAQQVSNTPIVGVQGRPAIPAKPGYDASADYKANSRAQMPVGDNRSPLNGGTDLDKMQQNFMRFAANTKNSSAIAQKAQADSEAAQPNRYLGDEGAKLAQVARSSGYRPPLAVAAAAAQGDTKANASPTAVDPTKNSWAGNYAAADSAGQGIFTDPETGRASIRLTGEAGNKFMQDQDKAIAEGKGVSTTADEMAARRKAMGGYGGMFKQPAPQDVATATARPGMTLRSTPVEYKRTASAGNVGGLPASEEFTPQAAPQRAAMPTATGNPLTDQRNAEAALARRQMEVMQAERNTPGLLYGPGSRDFIDPRLSESEQRTRQSEIAAQRIEDMRQARDATIAQTQARDAALAYKGLPTDEARNRAMEPYEERRATINQRNANMAMAGEQETARLAAADKVAERDAKEVQDVRKDATDRYVADKNAELATSNAQIGAESKRLDREATIKAALLKLEGVKDPVQLEKLKGYNSAIEAIMSMGQTPTAEQLLEIQKTYGVSDLFKPGDPYAKIQIPAPQQG